ncbi:MAG: carboxypeptidase-like regulatory domain-containing protein [Paludibacteraceae bacterium]|nr:carboxypeptidase-like regulatory domain-containing protein [Paludibacteraceae bacterium]
MKKFLVIACAFIMSCAPYLFAGDKNVSSNNNETLSNASKCLKGTVLDKNTKEALAGVTIIYDGQKIYTDLDGNFIIPNINKEKFKLKVNFISYQDQMIEIDTHNIFTCQILLSQL